MAEVVEMVEIACRDGGSGRCGKMVEVVVVMADVKMAEVVKVWKHGRRWHGGGRNDRGGGVHGGTSRDRWMGGNDGDVCVHAQECAMGSHAQTF